MVPADVLLIGDSFTIGGGLSDEQTLPERLRQKTGLRTYNGGTNKIVSPERISAMVKRLRMDHGLVVHEYMPRWDLGSYNSIAASMEPEEEEAAWRKMRTQLGELFLDSPIRGLTRRAYERLEDDRILPNAARENVRIHSLRNGDRMLFFPADEDSFYQSRPIDIFYWKKLRAVLRAGNQELLVMLVPDKYSVYQPLLSGVRPRSANTPEYLDELEKALKDAGIPVVNLLEAFRKEAANRIDGRSYIYWCDDTHWNADGVDLAVEMLSAAMPHY
jgi:hypothetical protein